MERRRGKLLALAVERHQARDVDHPLVHPPSLLPPGNRLGECVEQRVGTPHPALDDLEPRTAAQVDPSPGCHGARTDVVSCGKQ